MKNDIGELYKKAPSLFLLSKPSSIKVERIWNNIILFFGTILIFFLYVYNNIKVSVQSWDIQKCNPKYLFFSGYLHNNNPNLTGGEATLLNFTDCTRKIIVGKDSATGGGMQHFSDLMDENLWNLNEQTRSTYGKDLKSMKTSTEDISSQLQRMETELELNLDLSDAVIYNEIKNMGFYIDQLNVFMNYISQYTKQYLLHNMVMYINDCKKELDGKCDDPDNINYKKAMRIKRILEMAYGQSFPLDDILATRVPQDKHSTEIDSARDKLDSAKSEVDNIGKDSSRELNRNLDRARSIRSRFRF
jgi:hypothetical protein